MSVSIFQQLTFLVHPIMQRNSSFSPSCRFHGQVYIKSQLQFSIFHFYFKKYFLVFFCYVLRARYILASLLAFISFLLCIAIVHIIKSETHVLPFANLNQTQSQKCDARKQVCILNFNYKKYTFQKIRFSLNYSFQFTKVKLAAGGQPPSAAKTIIN